MTPIQQFMQSYGIPPAYEKDVNNYHFNAIHIVDDSGSMASRFGNITRWQFMQGFISDEVKTTTLLDPDGSVEIYFLNRTPEGGTHSFQNTPQDIGRLARSFLQGPSGGTPITATLDKVIEDITPSLAERKAHIRIHTDGIPDGGIETLNHWFSSKFMNKPSLTDKIAMTFNLVTDDQDTIREYQKIDALTTKSGAPAMIDMSLPYHIAKKIAESENPGFVYDEGTHKVKSFLGATNPDIDRLDERGGTITQQNIIQTENVRDQQQYPPQAPISIQPSAPIYPGYRAPSPTQSIPVAQAFLAEDSGSKYIITPSGIPVLPSGVTTIAHTYPPYSAQPPALMEQIRSQRAASTSPAGCCSVM